MDSVCLHCHYKCEIDLELVEGKIVGVSGALCIKGQTIPDVMYHPDRLKYPLKRVGERGEGRWERISWDEATTTIANKLNELKAKYGPGNLYIAGGSRQKHIGNQAIETAAALFPAPNRQCGRQECNLAMMIACQAIAGESFCSVRNMDFAHSKCLVIWGVNPDAVAPPGTIHARTALRQGAKLIVIDPRPIPMAKRADIWLKIRPGTDAALALGMMHTIINEGLYDKEFVEKWCVGFDRLKEHVQKYPPEWAAEVTWLSKEDIVDAARLYATTKPACLCSWIGPEQAPNASHRTRGIASLVAITGNIDAPGGNILTGKGLSHTKFTTQYHPVINPEVHKKRMGADVYPFLGARCDIYEVRRGMFDGRIRSLWCIAHNIIVAEADSRGIWEAMKNKLEFTVVSEFFMTPTAELADIVLPAAFYYEVDDLVEGWQYPYNYITARKKVVEPPGECRDDVEVVFEVARKMGADVPWASHKELLSWSVRDMGVTFDEVWEKPDHKITFTREYKSYERSTPPFNTPSGKVELYMSGADVERLGLDPLPVHKELPESPVSTPELFKEFPLIYTHYRIPGYMHTEGRQIERQRRMCPEPYLEISPETASKFGINEGDWVYLETTKSVKEKWPPLKYKARIIPELLSCVVAGPHGWWFPEKPGPEHGCFDSNINAALSAGPPYDPISGVSYMRGILCRIEKAENPLDSAGGGVI